MKTNFSIQSITDRSDLEGVRVFLRGALNVPVANGEITDDYRLKRLLPTIEWLKGQGARIILAGHMSGNEENTFRPVYVYLKKHFELDFVEDYFDPDTASLRSGYGASAAAEEIVNSMENGDVILLENLRQHDGEEANDPAFSKMLAEYADIYVNDAFPAAHRAHASIVGLPELLPHYAGLQFMREVEELSAVLHPERPFTFILGGAKFSTKLPLVEKFSGIADHVFVGGALANAYLAADGIPVGSSRVPDDEYDLQAGLASDVLQLPTDVVCQPATGDAEEKSVSDISQEDTIVDLGTDSVGATIKAVEDSTITVWNGPLGWYEKGFSEGTDRLAKALAKTEGKTILGGGDTAAVILDDLSPNDFSFVSTAGGAMITFLSQETLPGIQALEA